jgi:hypothetical protein
LNYLIFPISWFFYKFPLRIFAFSAFSAFSAFISRLRRYAPADFVYCIELYNVIPYFP